MHVIHARNVCEALPAGLSYLLEKGQREESRAGPVIVALCPVTTVYERPTERVLFSAVRDANPFFHLYESVWMFGGRDDAESLSKYVSDFGDRYADSGTVHGAYGYRWRLAFGFDQLDFVVEKLRTDPGSRQCVIQMWDTREGEIGPELGGEEYGMGDLRGGWRDRPCNTHVYLRVREENRPGPRGPNYEERQTVRVLDVTVCCRSNDAIWGAHGANAVHFSVLQEYLAARIGVGVGRYYQVSNNYHVYESEVERLCKRADAVHIGILPALRDDRYSIGSPLHPSPMFTFEPDTIDGDVRTFLEWHDSNFEGNTPPFTNSWFHNTLGRALEAHALHKQKMTHSAIKLARGIEAEDWRAACVEWLERRWR